MKNKQTQWLPWISLTLLLILLLSYAVQWQRLDARYGALQASIDQQKQQLSELVLTNDNTQTMIHHQHQTERRNTGNRRQ